ncbi:hypothetical protein GCM10007858_27030 [Bradyrhizobium liaoningense]|nr:hypothetical protein GCM10007858_27030 [Bradyrhizobium liaoningense]
MSGPPPGTTNFADGPEAAVDSQHALGRVISEADFAALWAEVNPGPKGDIQERRR